MKAEKNACPASSIFTVVAVRGCEFCLRLTVKSRTREVEHDVALEQRFRRLGLKEGRALFLPPVRADVVHHASHERIASTLSWRYGQRNHNREIEQIGA